MSFASSRIKRSCHAALGLFGFSAVTIPFILDALKIGAPGFGNAELFLFTAGTLSLVLCLIVGRASAEIGLLCATSFFGVLTIGVVTHQYYTRVVAGFDRIWASPMSMGIFQDDPLFGYSLVPNNRGKHHLARGSWVYYEVDELGTRAIKRPKNATHSVLFLGGSFTFGQGVEDWQTFSAKFAKLRWPEFAVYNRAAPSWGPSNGLLSLEKHLKEVGKPDLVVYGWIPTHLMRSYNRYIRVHSILKQPRPYTYFDLVDGEPVFQGNATLEGAVSHDHPELREKEFQLTKAILKKMDAISRNADAKFHILRLVQKDQTFAKEFMEDEARLFSELERDNIFATDLTGTPGGYVEGDGHPDAVWHERVALKIKSLPEHLGISSTNSTL